MMRVARRLYGPRALPDALGVAPAPWATYRAWAAQLDLPTASEPSLPCCPEHVDDGLTLRYARFSAAA
eukprot:8776314-Lingulodinium_polyedra.AAC.1